MNQVQDHVLRALRSAQNRSRNHAEHAARKARNAPHELSEAHYLARQRLHLSVVFELEVLERIFLSEYKPSPSPDGTAGREPNGTEDSDG